MPLFGKGDEAQKRFEEAKRYSHPEKKEFDLDTAIRLLEEALTLKPDNNQYRQKLDEIREIKEKRSLEFSMRVWDARAVILLDGELGTAASGIVEQGTIQDGDEVKIRRGRRVTKSAKVFEVGSATGDGFAVAGQHVEMAIIGDVDLKEGDIIEAVTMELATEIQMKQPSGQKSSAWFWVGFALLTLSAGWVTLVIIVTVDEGNGGMVIAGLITLVPIGIGIYGIWRGITKRWAWTAVMIVALWAAIGGTLTSLFILGISWVSVPIILAITLGVGLLVSFAEERRKRHL